MKTSRRIFACGTAVLLLGALMVPRTLEAWSPISEVVPVKGTVHEYLSVRVSAPPPGVDLNDLILWNEADGSVDVGPQVVQASDVTVETNNFEGLRLTVYLGYMTHESEPGQQVQFFGLLTDDGAPPPSWDAFDKTSNFVQNVDQGKTRRDLYFAYDPPHYLEPGWYSGVVTLRVEAIN